MPLSCTYLPDTVIVQYQCSVSEIFYYLEDLQRKIFNRQGKTSILSEPSVPLIYVCDVRLDIFGLDIRMTTLWSDLMDGSSWTTSFLTLTAPTLTYTSPWRLRQMAVFLSWTLTFRGDQMDPWNIGYARSPSTPAYIKMLCLTNIWWRIPSDEGKEGSDVKSSCGLPRD
jgi:hypothetical protein